MEHESTARPDYAERLKRIQLAGWKNRLRRFDPYGIYLRSLRLGRTLEVGCGVGRNLQFLAPNAVGVDHNSDAVETCRQRGLVAWTPDELSDSIAEFDSLLFSHVLEHLELGRAPEILAEYLPRLRQNGRVILITPQERGYRSDPTHVTFIDFETADSIAKEVGLRVEHQASFPFPRVAGGWWVYNEFVTIAGLISQPSP